jgi:2'-5' RNA ligase
MGLIRAFIAVDIPPAIQRSLQQVMDRLRQPIGDAVRWVPASNIHLTLKFLGDIPPSSVDLLTRMLQAEADSCPAFDLSVGRLGSFPNSKRARVLWVGVQAAAGLEALQRGIESAAVKLGCEADGRPFSPHLTLGRVRDTATPSDLGRIHKTLEATAVDSLGTARVDSVHLYKSELKPGGPVYTKLYSAPLSLS